MSAQLCFDPIADLPGDLAAICLSFVGVTSLLRAVSRVWRDAIDGGLPAVWYDVWLHRYGLTKPELEEVVQKSRGRIRRLLIYHSRLGSPGAFLHTLRSLSDLRVLSISSPVDMDEHSFTAVLSSFRLLEELFVGFVKPRIVLPPLQHLHTLRYDCRPPVSGLHNLPALTKLEAKKGPVDAIVAWPAGLREVTILNQSAFNPQIVARIATLQQLVALSTDWSFVDAKSSFFAPPFDQLSFLAGFTTLQRLDVDFERQGMVSHPCAIVFNYLGAMTSLRQLHIKWAPVADKDLQCLTQLKNLEDLSFTDLGEITGQGLRAVLASGFPNLVKLSIRRCYCIGNYSSVGLCSGLRHLDIVHGMYPLSLAEVRAIARLHHLETLYVFCQLQDPAIFSHFCTLSHLRKLDVKIHWWQACVPAVAFSALPALSCMQELVMCNIKSKDIAAMVDCLAQMPTLRRICIQTSEHGIGEQNKTRLRNMLPRLEAMSICSCPH